MASIVRQTVVSAALGCKFVYLFSSLCCAYLFVLIILRLLSLVPPAQNSVSYVVRVKQEGFYSQAAITSRRGSVRKYNNTDHGQLIRSIQSDREKQRRKEMSGAFVLPNGEKSDAFCGKLMNTAMDKLGGRSAVDYATDIGAVYVWLSSQETAVGIKHESVRFITDGQSRKGSSLHNAVLMWNPDHHEFENNICPYIDRFRRGLKPLTQKECDDLGIEFLLLVDEDMTARAARNIEKMCQYEIQHLPLGSRLHRTLGAGISLKGSEAADVVARRTIGITYLPPNFFVLNTSICVVASAL